MEDVRVDRLFSLARTGRMSRRQILETGLRLGLASPVIISIEAGPKTASAAPTVPTRRRTDGKKNPVALTILWTSGTEDIDPHYTYSELASAVALLVYEMLLIQGRHNRRVRADAGRIRGRSVRINRPIRSSFTPTRCSMTGRQQTLRR